MNLKKSLKILQELLVRKIVTNFQELDQSEGENFAQGVWKLKKKEFPRNSQSIPAAKTDINGRTVTDPSSIKQLYLDTFCHRLRERPKKEDNADLFELQQKLLEKRLLITAYDKSPQWTETDVFQVLSSLKNGKCKDPLWMINEIFKPPVAGADLIKSITIMMNLIKDQSKIPDIFRYKNISTIYKNKGSRSSLENDRGIFICTVLDTILQKLTKR